MLPYGRTYGGIPVGADLHIRPRIPGCNVSKPPPFFLANSDTVGATIGRPTKRF